MNNFDRRQLRYFVAVAEDLHFGHAAKRLQLSQPSLSQQIVALENDLGVKLFARTRRSVELTVAGQQFLQDAKNILAEMLKAATRAHAADEGCTGRLRIGMNYSAPFHSIPTKIFGRFLKLYPDVRLELNQETGAKQLELLHRHALDIAFVWPTHDDLSSNFTFIPLDGGEVKIVVGENHELARKTRILLADLREKPLFLMPWQTRTNFYDALVKAYSKEGFRLDPRLDIIQMPFVMSVVAASQGITFVPSFLEHIRPSGITFHAFNFLPQAARTMPLCMALRTDDASPVVHNFIKNAKAIIAEKM